MLPSLQVQAHALDASPFRDLTGQVVKLDIDPFATGGTSDIYLGRFVHDIAMVEKFAVKVMRGKFDDTSLRRLKRQLRVWKNVEHENIIALLGISLDFHGRKPCLVFPYLRNGSIMDYLKNHPNASELTFIHQTAEALSYLHSRGIVHGDIKGENVLINDNRNVCLVDFGISQILHESGFTTGTLTCTLRFTAPEIYALDPVTHDKTAVPKFTTECDVWAFSMFVIQVFTGLKPFSRLLVDASVCECVLNGGRPRRIDCPEIDDTVWDKLCECWNKSPEKRPSMGELSNFFRSLLISHTTLPSPQNFTNAHNSAGSS